MKGAGRRVDAEIDRLRRLDVGARRSAGWKSLSATFYVQSSAPESERTSSTRPTSLAPPARGSRSPAAPKPRTTAQ